VRGGPSIEKPGEKNESIELQGTIIIAMHRLMRMLSEEGHCWIPEKAA